MSVEPSLALQTALRARLVDTPAVLALVPADHIRDGLTRPDKFPTIIVGDGQTVLEGYYPGRRNVTVHLDVHVWALESGLAAVKEIGNEVWTAIADEPLDVPGYLLSDGVHVTVARYLRDPSEQHGHAVLSIEAFMSGEWGE